MWRKITRRRVWARQLPKNAERKQRNAHPDISPEHGGDSTPAESRLDKHHLNPVAAVEQAHRVFERGVGMGPFALYELTAPRREKGWFAAARAKVATPASVSRNAIARNLAAASRQISVSRRPRALLPPCRELHRTRRSPCRRALGREPGCLSISLERAMMGRRPRRWQCAAPPHPRRRVSETTKSHHPNIRRAA